jgi:competence protein ComEA
MLTPSERRGALMVLALIALGTSWDLWRATHPRWRLLVGDREPVAARDSLATNGSTAEPAAHAGPGMVDDSVARAPSARRGKPRPTRPIDLNRAAAEEFHTLPGIGPVLARRIVDYRSAHGPFTSVEELRAVRGIGPKLFERLKPYVRV